MANPDRIKRAILLIRGEKVLLDSDLAILYAVPVKVLNQAVSRNLNRFPSDFMFRLSRQEATSLRSQSVTLERGRGRYRKYLPYAFTERGVGMLSSVLRSGRAILVNVAIMRAFVKYQLALATVPELKRRLDALERKYDARFHEVFDAIRALIEPQQKPSPRIGFRSAETAGKPSTGRARV